MSKFKLETFDYRLNYESSVKKAVDFISKAKKELKMFEDGGFPDDERVYKALEKALERGVKIEIIASKLTPKMRKFLKKHY